MTPEPRSPATHARAASAVITLSAARRGRGQGLRRVALVVAAALGCGILWGCPPPAASPPSSPPAPDDGGARAPDGGLPLADAGSDAGRAEDAGRTDAGSGSGPLPDAGLSDAGLPDAQAHDAGLNDAGLDDAGLNDAGLNDAGLNDAGTVARRDACATDTDCGAGRCVALPEAPGATRVCVVVPEPYRHACGPGANDASFNECCADAECVASATPGEGRCLAFQVGYCGGAAPPEANLCRYPECASDADCGADRACLPAGAFGFSVATCVDASCRTDGDCTARPGGECRALRNGACGSVGGFYCTYAADPCREDRDCASALFPARCVPEGAGTVCEEQFLPP